MELEDEDESEDEDEELDEEEDEERRLIMQGGIGIPFDEVSLLSWFQCFECHQLVK